MRSLVITALVLFFNIFVAVLANVAPYIYMDTPANVNLNQTIVTNMTDKGQIVSSQTGGLNMYFSGQVNMISMIASILTGTIFVGLPLYHMGMSWYLAAAIDAILSVLVLFDLFYMWTGKTW